MRKLIALPLIGIMVTSLFTACSGNISVPVTDAAASAASSVSVEEKEDAVLTPTLQPTKAAEPEDAEAAEETAEEESKEVIIEKESWEKLVKGIDDVYILEGTADIDYVKIPEFDEKVKDIVKKLTVRSNEVDTSKIGDYDLVFKIRVAREMLEKHFGDLTNKKVYIQDQDTKTKVYVDEKEDNTLLLQIKVKAHVVTEEEAAQLEDSGITVLRSEKAEESENGTEEKQEEETALTPIEEPEIYETEYFTFTMPDEWKDQVIVERTDVGGLVFKCQLSTGEERLSSIDVLDTPSENGGDISAAIIWKETVQGKSVELSFTNYPYTIPVDESLGWEDNWTEEDKELLVSLSTGGQYDLGYCRTEYERYKNRETTDLGSLSDFYRQKVIPNIRIKEAEPVVQVEETNDSAVSEVQ